MLKLNGDKLAFNKEIKKKQIRTKILLRAQT